MAYLFLEDIASAGEKIDAKRYEKATLCLGSAATALLFNVAEAFAHSRNPFGHLLDHKGNPLDLATVESLMAEDGGLAKHLMDRYYLVQAYSEGAGRFVGNHLYRANYSEIDAVSAMTATCGFALWYMSAFSKGPSIPLRIALDRLPTSWQHVPIPTIDGPVVRRIEVTNIGPALRAALARDPSASYQLTAAEFELFVCERLDTMGFESRQIQPHREEPGIDVVFWPKERAAFPFLGAVQIRHHRDPRASEGVQTVREFLAAMSGHPFGAGLLVTNSTFTPNAQWFAREHAKLVKLRDILDIRRWLQNNFSDPAEWREIPELIELCPGVAVDLRRLNMVQSSQLVATRDSAPPMMTTGAVKRYFVVRSFLPVGGTESEASSGSNSAPTARVVGFTESIPEPPDPVAGHTQAPIELFVSYSPEDESLRGELDSHLASLKREGLISQWHARCVTAGEDRQASIDERLDSARLVLLLVSPDFLASDYLYCVEMARALDRRARGEAAVIPIILRPSDWTSAPFAHLEVLPIGGDPVTRWPDRDEAWLAVVRGLRAAVAKIPVP